MLFLTSHVLFHLGVLLFFKDLKIKTYPGRLWDGPIRPRRISSLCDRHEDAQKLLLSEIALNATEYVVSNVPIAPKIFSLWNWQYPKILLHHLIAQTLPFKKHVSSLWILTWKVRQSLYEQNLLNEKLWKNFDMKTSIATLGYIFSSWFNGRYEPPNFPQKLSIVEDWWYFGWVTA